MKLTQRVVAGMSTVALASTVTVGITAAPAAAESGPNMAFCEPMADATETFMFVGLISAFANLGGSESTASTGDELTGEQAIAVVSLMFGPFLGKSLKAAAAGAKDASFKKALEQMSKVQSESETVLKKAGVPEATIKSLRTFNASDASAGGKTATQEAKLASLEDKLTSAQKKKIATDAGKWMNSVNKMQIRQQSDSKLTKIGDAAIADCTPVNNKGERVKDACKVLPAAMVTSTISGKLADGESDDSVPLMRMCSVSGDGGELTLTVTTPNSVKSLIKGLPGAKGVSGIGKSAKVTDGFGSMTLSNFSGSSSGKTILVVAGKTAFSLGLDKTNPDTGDAVKVSQGELVAAAKAVAKNLKI